MAGLESTCRYNDLPYWLLMGRRPGNMRAVPISRSLLPASPGGIFLTSFSAVRLFTVLQIVASLRYLAARNFCWCSNQLKPSASSNLLAGSIHLESNLRTFFEQDYPSFEILFALRHASDPAVEVVDCRRSNIRTFHRS